MNGNFPTVKPKVETGKLVISAFEKDAPFLCKLFGCILVIETGTFGFI